MAAQTSGERNMPKSLDADDPLHEQVIESGLTKKRSTARQIEFRAKVERTALANPDLPSSFIVESLISMDEPRAQARPFIPRDKKHKLLD
jgi:hypothetical protein